MYLCIGRGETNKILGFKTSQKFIFLRNVENEESLECSYVCYRANVKLP